MSNKGIIIGIDLGTTRSCFGRFDTQKKVGEILVNAEGHRTTPSVVSLDSDGKFIVGDTALNKAVLNSERTFYGVKRLIGNQFDDLSPEHVKNSSYKIVKSADGYAKISANNKEYTPSEIVSKILQKIKSDAEAKLGQKVSGAVITVPAYFNDAQRQATKDASEIAGLKVERIINEPTAAALAYGIDKSTKSTKIAVYDLGGGTFDVSILELEDGVFEVLSTSGNAQLGGEDFDERIIEFFKSEFKNSSGIDISNDNTALQRLKTEAEKSKKELSSVEEVDINIPFLSVNQNGPHHLSVKLTRGKLESLVRDLIDKTKDPCIDALSSANLDSSEISEVILVGGMTRMPAVQKYVCEIFNKKELNQSVNPDEVVAMGATIQAGVLMGSAKGIVLLDVTPLSLGIETLGGVFTKLIEKNATIPCKKSQVFSTADDNQSAVTIKVAQGERVKFADNKLLGQFNLEGIPPAQRGVPQIEVTFEIDANGIVHVSAKDKLTNKEQKIIIQASGGLSKEEIEAMKADAEENAEQDKKYKEFVELKSNSESIISVVEQSIKENDEKIPSDLKEKVEKYKNDLSAMIKEDNIDKYDEIKKSYDTLFAESQAIGEHLYKTTQEQADQTSDDKTTEQNTEQSNEEDKK